MTEAAAEAPQLYHLVQTALWARAVQSKQPYFPPTYAQDGFIHMTADPDLLLEVANRFYKSSDGDWEVLVIDPAKLTAEVKFEAAAPVGSTAARPSDDRRWPHLYGTLDHDAVLQRLAIRRDADGSFLSIEHSEQAEGSSSSAA